MSNENYLYQGNVQIHLQGQHALLPIDSKQRGSGDVLHRFEEIQAPDPRLS